ncbi:MAG: alpha-amylase C-terminal beta-sheet domain-containing protein [Elusimicrobiales bacterium]|jgi:alpha-amylase
MKIKRSWLIILSTFYILPVSARNKAIPSLEELKTQANSVSAAVPRPSTGAGFDLDKFFELPPRTRVDPVRADWLEAGGLYRDEVFRPAPQDRVDVDGSPAIMLQGFHWYADGYWYHPPKGWWGVLEQNAGEIARSGFNLVWFPPASNGSYYPNEWYNLDSQWGTRAALVQAVNAMHAAGVKVVADIVLNHRNGATNWLDFKNPDWPSTVIVRNDEVWAQPAYAGLARSPNDDEGQGELGCRDLDHKDPLVRQDATVFLRWLKNTIGFDGWRYDMVKGFAPSHIKNYNEASSPVFSVGEYYDGNRQLITDWIDGTDNSPGKPNASSAFDFPTRFSLIAAVEGDRYELLNDNGRPSGLIGWWPSKAVTFVENHDTSPRDPAFINNAPAQYRDQRLMGYAYILTHPGIPCVFWPHLFDWGPAYKAQLQALAAVRRNAGITSTSQVRIISATNGLYAAVVTGKTRRVALKLGSSWDWQPGNGWTLAASGEKYAVWTQSLKKRPASFD